MKRIKVAFDKKRGIYQRVVLEEDVLCQIRALLELNGARVFRAIERVPKCYRCGQWLGASEAGTPDLSGYFPLEMANSDNPLIVPFWLEVKRPKKNKKREAQIFVIESIRHDGGCAAIVESWEQVLALMDAHSIPLRVRG